MISAFFNCLKIAELRQRILLTLGMIFVARLGTNIPLPGLNPEPLRAYFEVLANTQGGGGFLGMMNMFTGRAMLSGSILTLGIMPYISASIIMQMLSAIEPHLSQLSQEGEIGRQKIAQYTRYVTILIAVVQGLMMVSAMAYYPDRLFLHYDVAQYGQIVIGNKVLFLITATINMTAGSVLLMWIGEQITQFGIGNGVSLLITINILSSLPSAFVLIWTRSVNPPIGVDRLEPVQLLLMVVLLALVVAGVIALTQGQRKIPVQYAKRVVGRRVFQGQSSYLPLKVNYAGVMPIIFASAILLFPQQFFMYMNAWFPLEIFRTLSESLSRGGSYWYYIIYAMLIFGFSFFWVFLMFRPVQVADDLKKYGGYIPGVPPGTPTAKFLDFTMTRLTFAGAVFLTIVAVLPDGLSSIYKVPQQISQFFGGTGTLIIVGVLLDTMRQVETFLLQRHYDGFLQKGRAKNRNASRALQALDRQEIRNLRVLWVPLLVLFVAGLIAYFFNPHTH